MPWPVTLKPGNSRSRNRTTRSSSMMKRMVSPLGRVGRQADEALDLGGQRHQGAHALAVFLAQQQQRHHQAHVGDERERMRRIDRQRGQDREHPLHEPGLQPGQVVVRQRLRAPQTSMPASLQQAPSARARRAAARPAGASARSLISASCWAGVRPSGVSLVSAGLGLADQAGDADRVEFIQVGGADRQEAHAFQQRVAGVLRLLHHAVVEVEPGEFAVDEPVRAVGRDLGWHRRAGPGRCGTRARQRRVHARRAPPGWMTGSSADPTDRRGWRRVSV